METERKYSISFTGLSNGVHSFIYHIENDFFENIEYSPIQNGSVDVEIEFEKQERFFVLQFRYTGSILVQCDRCIADVHLPVNGNASLLVKISQELPEVQDDDEVMYIHASETHVDFSQFLYENIIVDIPLYKTCEDDIQKNKTCDGVVLEVLEGNDKNINKEPDIDPRWEQLLKLKNSNYGTSEE